MARLYQLPGKSNSLIDYSKWNSRWVRRGYGFSERVRSVLSGTTISDTTEDDFNGMIKTCN
jgi:hypothetical protein